MSGKRYVVIPDASYSTFWGVYDTREGKTLSGSGQSKRRAALRAKVLNKHPLPLPDDPPTASDLLKQAPGPVAYSVTREDWVTLKNQVGSLKRRVFVLERAMWAPPSKATRSRPQLPTPPSEQIRKAMRRSGGWV